MLKGCIQLCERRTYIDDGFAFSPGFVIRIYGGSLTCRSTFAVFRHMDLVQRSAQVVPKIHHRLLPFALANVLVEGIW